MIPDQLSPNILIKRIILHT